MNRNRPAANDRAAQNAATLKTLVKLESNKVCADCKRNKHPRWASWNLGVFVCIRCSGIHRGMGTHISRVKSVDLDAWTDEQLQSILKWGNARANKYWESKLQAGHVPSEGKMENFIRTKYESKRWVMDGPMPDPSTLGDDDDVPLNVVQEKAKIERSASQRQGESRQTQQPAVRAPPQQASIDLFDDFEPPARPSTTDAASRQPPAPVQATKPASQSNNLMGLDFFGAPQQAGVGRPTSAASNPHPATNARGDLKNSILSLYASAPKPQSQPQQPQQPQQGHERQSSFGGMSSTTTQPKQDAFGGLADAFGGMSFAPTTSNTVRPQPAQSSTSSFGFPSATPSQPIQSSAFGGLNYPTAMPSKTTPIAQVSSPPPLSGGDFFASSVNKPSAPKPAPSNGLDFSFTQKTTSAPIPQTKAATSIPSDLFGDDGFNNFSAAPAPTSTATSKVPSPPPQSPGGFSSPFNLSSSTMTAPKASPITQVNRPAVTTQSSTSMFDPWGGAESNAWGAPEPAKPAAPKVELGSVPTKITPNDISGSWGAPISGTTNTTKSTTQPTVIADEDFGGWTSAATPAASKPSQGFGGASDPFDNPWG